jgi:hypothetical protein
MRPYFALKIIKQLMENKTILRVLSIALISLTALGILMVSMMAFSDPQAVMALVHVQLDNNDAYSSIRGVYGGAGMVMVITLVYLGIRDQMKGLLFVAMIAGFYSLSRLITIMVEGSLGDFGSQWLKIESCMCIAALLVYRLRVMALKK